MALAAASRLIYGPSPQEKLQKWQQQIKKEQRMLDREARQLSLAQDRTRSQLKQLANKGQLQNAKTLAREFVKSRKQANRIATSKAMLNSIGMQLQHQAAVLKITGTLEKSTEILKMCNALIKLPELSQTVSAMSAEMTKAGLMSELVDDAFETLDEDQEELEEEAEGEVEKVLFEITDGKLGTAGKVSSTPLATAARDPELERQEEEDTRRMQQELNALLG